ncbi:BapA/Bap/LapF family large adhesin, partial [Acinetobacter schindleri]|uniref:BapA/Bap/LapF family large adhesin n=1 Tax=Acinetobacter schindleri TaxID=108981 RepID=UPI003F544B64
ELATDTADEEGNFSVVLEPAVENGTEVEVTATDAAGNESDSVTAVADTATDTTAPEVPVIEGFDGTTVVGTAEPGSTITIRDTEGNELATDTADEEGNFIIDLENPFSNGEELNIVATDTSGNESTPVSINAPDTTPPIIESIAIADGLGSITVVTEPNANVVLTDAEGNELASGQAGENGVYIYTPNAPFADGALINVVVSDAAGNNTSDEIRAGIEEVVAAADNNVQLVLDVTPTEIANPTPSSLNSTGFSVGAVGLGPVLNVSVLESVLSSSVEIDVAEGTTRELTFYANAVGLTVGTMDLFMYKRNVTTGEWELRESIEDWYTVVLGGAASAITRTFDEGEWLLVLGNGEGLSLATGYTMLFTGDVVNDFNNPVAITGTSAGNVITDTDYQNGTDQVPVDSLITSVNGTTLNTTGVTTIQGQYGTLTIQPDGTYSYSANANFREYGETDSFTYVITAPDGKTVTAELNIELVRIPSNEDVIIDDTVTLTVQPLETVLTGNQITIEDATAINLLNLGVAGNVLSASVIGTEGVMDFTVGAGTLRELTFQGSGGGLSVAVTYGFTIYRQDEETGLFVQVHQEPSFLYVPFLASGRSDPLTLSFGEGTYIAIIAATGGVDLAGGASVEVTVDKTYDYNAPVQLNGTTSGDVTADDTVQLVEVNDQIVQEGTATTVVGQFGTLVINFDGTYTYSVTKPADTTGWQPPYGEIERFELVKQAADGKSFIDILNIAIQTHEAVDDFESIIIDSRNSSERTFTADESLLNENNVAINFELTDYQYAETLTLNASVTRTSLASTPTATILITKDGETVYQGPIAVTWGRGIGQAAYNGKISAPITLPEDTDFTSGEYTVTINLNGNLTNIRNITSAELTGNIINDISFNGEPVEAIIGNILQDNDQANDQIDILKIGRQELYVNDLAKGASSFTVQGQHGVLILNKDGSYSYQPSGESSGIETFTYTTISKVGTEQTATLEISVGMNLTGSDLDEQVVASDAEDVFTLGGGADTVIYEVLNAGQNEGTADIWTDFSLTEGDAIDVSALLTGANAENISEYISVEVNDNNATVISIDRDGAGTQFRDKVELITLEGVNTNLEELLSNGHIIY